MFGVGVQVSSVLLSSVDILYDQYRKNVLSLSSPEASWRPVRIALLFATLGPALLFFAYGYICGAVGLTVATVEGPKLASPNEKAPLEEKKSSADSPQSKPEDTADSSTQEVKPVEPDSDSKATSKSPDWMDYWFLMAATAFPQARTSILRTVKERHASPGLRHALVYLLLNVLISHSLRALIGSDTAPKQWITHLTTSILLSSVRMQWTHATLTSPAFPTPYFCTSSLAECVAVYRALLLPTLAYAIAQPAVVLCTGELTKVIFDFHEGKDFGWAMLIAWAVTIMLVGFCVAAGLIATLVTPALMVLNRIEVSLLGKDVPTAVALYNGHDAVRNVAETTGKSFYGQFVAPSMLAWQSISKQRLREMSWLCLVVVLWVALPGWQFLQIGISSGELWPSG